jgi:hypothetical protein
LGGAFGYYGKVRTFAGRSLSDCPFRYQGVNETGNPNITKIGIDILKEVGKYDPNKTAK